MQTNDQIVCKGNRRFVILKELGSGGQGEVWLVKDLDREEKHAFKLIKESDPQKKRRKMANIRNLVRRSDLLRPSLERQNFTVALPEYLYEKGEEFGYIMPVCEGESINRMMIDKKFVDMPTKERLTMVRKIAEAAAWLQSNGLSYQDFSHKNVMYEPSRSTVCLIDCDNVAPSSASADGAAAFAGGTGFYAPPEIAFRQCHPSLESDRFALAVLFFKIMTGSTTSPYHGKNLYTRCCRPADMFEAAELTNEEPDFGTDWMTFVFDPTNPVNAIDPKLYKSPDFREGQEMILKNWAKVPEAVRAFFCRAFREPLNPEARKKRPTPSEWVRVAQGEGSVRPTVPKESPKPAEQTKPSTQPSVPKAPAPARTPSVTFLPSGKQVALTASLPIEIEAGSTGVVRRMGTIEKVADGYTFRAESPYKVNYYRAGGPSGGLSRGESIPLKDGVEIFWMNRPSERVKVSLP